MKRFTLLTASVLSGLALSCLTLSSLANGAQAKTLETVASFTVIADMVHNVGGDHVHVTSLIGPNGDPHVYEPTPNDAQALKKADVVFVSGLHLEGWLDRLITASGYKGDPVVLSNGIMTRSMEEDGEQITDPHAWNSAVNGVVYVRNIIAALQKADPANAADYKSNGERYIKQLQDMDAYARTQIKSILKAQRKVLTSHDAFGYFGDAYGVSFLSPLGFSTETEGTRQRLLLRELRRSAPGTADRQSQRCASWRRAVC
jgi:zinc/manganese transport system substrate-binding protein